MIQSLSFGTTSFAENPEPRLPCVLLLDVSGSMEGQPIAELNAGLLTYVDALAADSLASKRVEVALVTFGGEVRTVCDFTTADAFLPPRLSAGGDTPMGAAIHQAIALLNRRKEVYRANGISFFRPWIFLITDGGPTDEWHSAADKVGVGEANRSFAFFVVGVEGANFDVLQRICAARPPLKLKGLRFQDLFLWLSSSQASQSRSRPGEWVPLQDPTGPQGWGAIPSI
ncbi:MAG TPA: VWA domain-containing protein [Gemmataceae bacterium]|nr:VWA domain-containing protein [Gemmataceae bacterium]